MSVYACPGCGAVNRVADGRLGDDPICGRCKKKLFPHEPFEVTDATFEAQVLRAPLPTLVDIWAPWCGPCRMVAPVVAQIAAERGGDLLVAKLNSDENPRTAARYEIRSIPTLIVFRGGVPVERIVGAVPKARLDQTLARILQEGQTVAP
jgi:thioredoxin 2